MPASIRHLQKRLAQLAAALTTSTVPVLAHGRRPAFWVDHEVRDLVTRMHRVAEIGQVVEDCRKRFGEERTPSRSAVHRYWMRLDAIMRAT